MKNLIALLKMLNISLSKSFFGSQASVLQILKDRFFAGISKDIKIKEFDAVVGNIVSEDIPEFEAILARPRGNGDNQVKTYSISYTINQIPEVLINIISRHRKKIEEYLGLNYLYEPVLIFRNYRIPEEFETYDIYSNVWHQDSHDGERLLKIFVLLMDISDNDGPFTYLNRAATLTHWSELMERWDFRKMSSTPKYAEENYATGLKGSYLIINTAQCMHRAQNPQNFRDMMQIALYPSWRATGERKRYDF